MDVVVTLLMLAAATLLGMVLFGSKLSNSSIMMVYLLGVLLVAVITSHRACSIAAAVASLFLFNFFFIQPRYSLAAYEPGYPVSLIVMFLTAVIAGTLANRLKQTAYQAARTSFRSRIISDTDQLLAKAQGREEILRVCAEQRAKGRRASAAPSRSGTSPPRTGGSFSAKNCCSARRKTAVTRCA